MPTHRYVDLQSDFTPPSAMIAFADNAPIVAPVPMQDALDHWRFGVSSASRVGLVNGLQLRLGLAQTAITTGSAYTSNPDVTLAGAGATGLTGFSNTAGGGVFSVGITGQPQDDTSAVTATFSGGGGAGGAVTLSRGSEPTYNAASAVIAAGRQNGLISSINDMAVYTQLFLIKRPPSGTDQRIGGTAMYTGGQRGTTIGGDGPAWLNNNNLAINGAGLNDSPLTPPTSWTPGTWGVVAVSQSANTRTFMAFGPDGTSTQIVQSGAKTVANPQRKLAIGGIHYDFGSVYAQLEISEWVPFNIALTASQMTSRAYDLLDNARINGLI